MSNFENAKIYPLSQAVEYTDGGIVSKQVIKTSGGNATLFSFDESQGLSEHSAPFDAMVQVLDGKGTILIDSKPYVLKAGEMIIMPANIPHAIRADEKFKMILFMAKEIK
jgi:quercetin dioxygenase-like cupin family protein